MSASDDYIEILKDLNDKLNLKPPYGYRPGVASNKLIHARLAEGFTVDDFKHVHTVMCAKWGDDNKMSQYLRPSTLYSASKFQGYLNVRPAVAPIPVQRYF